jgi:hypothetical protein
MPLQVSDSLDYWRPRTVGYGAGGGDGTLTWSALDILYNPRQRELYAADADVIRSARFSRL